MRKWKAIICTILYVIVITVVLTASLFVKSHVNGISLYQLIMCTIGGLWIGNSVMKFYEWLRKEE